jgi:outer membrane protein OmpA-like peptidoglycan-associated protein
MHKARLAAAALLALPIAEANAQSDWFTSSPAYQPFPGFYVGMEGGANWNFNHSMGFANAYPTTGWAAGAILGYDFVGPRIELEGVFRQNSTYFTGLGTFGSFNASRDLNQVAVMANLLYDFAPGAVITPYIGAGAGVAFVDGMDIFGTTTSLSNTVFAYQGIIGVGYNVDSNLRINLDARYHGTTDPASAYGNWNNNNITALLSVTYKFGQPVAAAPPPAPAAPSAPSFMVFFDWDRSNLSQQALSTIQQAADAYRTRGSARITATGHTDTSGPASYNMALSLRRANAVKDALVRDGVPATAISVVGRGETQPLVPTGDGVREPQNRRVEIVIE